MHKYKGHGYKLRKSIIDLQFKKKEKHVQVLFIIHMNEKKNDSNFVCLCRYKRKDKNGGKRQGGGTVLGQKGSSQVFETNTWEKEVLHEKIATCTT